MGMDPGNLFLRFSFLMFGSNIPPCRLEDCCDAGEGPTLSENERMGHPEINREVLDL